MIKIESGSFAALVRSYKKSLNMFAILQHICQENDVALSMLPDEVCELINLDPAEIEKQRLSGRLRFAEEYLMQLGIYNVILVEENDVRNYKRFLLEDRDCTIRAANSMTSFLRNKKAYWIEQEYGDLLEEIRQCEGIEMPLTGNIKNFLIREGIHHIREIDYSIREKYEQ